jgi:hypothetical protein
MLAINLLEWEIAARSGSESMRSGMMPIVLESHLIAVSNPIESFTLFRNYCANREVDLASSVRSNSVKSGLVRYQFGAVRYQFRYQFRYQSSCFVPAPSGTPRNGRRDADQALGHTLSGE